MSNIEDMRNLIKTSFRQLVSEEPKIVDFDPLNEIIESMNKGYERMPKKDGTRNPNIREIDRSFILKASNVVEIKKDYPDMSVPFRGFKGGENFGSSAGGSIFDIPSSSSASIRGPFDGKSQLKHLSSSGRQINPLFQRSDIFFEI